MINKLKFIIVQKGYTNREIAKQLKINEQTISNWCNNKNISNIYTFFKLCKFLNVDIRDIFND